MMNYRFMYLKDRKGQFVGCIAIKMRRHTDYDRCVIEYRTSVLNPVDKFNRRLARHLALGRVTEAPFTVIVPSDPSMYEITHGVMYDIARDASQPTRARLAARFWLRNNGRNSSSEALFI